jgi:glucose uptake protein
MQIYGFLAGIGSMILFGSGGAPLKIKKVANLKTFPTSDSIGLHPLLFHIYLLLGIFILSILLWSYVPVHVDEYVTIAAIVQSILFLPANILAIAAIQQIGIATAISIWAGTSILVSFIWGITLLSASNQVTDPLYCVFALLLLIVGLVIFVIAFRLEIKKDEPVWSGIISAFIVGLLNGCLLVPQQALARFSDRSIEIFSFNVTILFSAINLAISPGLICCYFGIQRTIKWSSLPLFHWKYGFPAGFGTGVIWGLGNILSVYATLYLGISIGFPLSQLALVVNGLWAVLVFKELKTCMALTLWGLATLLLLMGGFILTNSVNQGIF